MLGFRPRESRALLLVVNVMTILRITSIFSSAVYMSKTRGMHYERHCERVVAIVCYLKLKVVETQRWWCFELKGGPSPKQEGNVI